MSHDDIATALKGFGGLLRCTVCDREQALDTGRDVANYLGKGWPKCHGYTMTWVTQSQLDEEEAQNAGSTTETE